MRKPVTIKLDEADLERWDSFAASHGYTRTGLIEAALELITGHDIDAPIKADAEKRTPPVIEPESQASREKWPPLSTYKSEWGGVGNKPPIQKRRK